MNEKKHPYSIYMFAFLLPILILSIVFAIFSVWPFGSRTVLTVDLYHQYIHYYSYFIEALKGKQSLLYSWDAGLGSNFIGDIAYYTSSPLLLILLLFPKELYPEAVLVMILIKIGLCGLTASFYIRKKFTVIKSYEAVLFASFYALMSYTVAYYYNVMWLDGVILLPLLILCVDNIIERKSFIPYTFFLSLLMVANFYIAYMVGLFIFLYFILEFFILLKKNSAAPLEWKAVLYRFVGGTFLSIGISAFLTVPTFFQLLQTLGPKQEYHYPINFNFLFKILSGVYDSDINGSPNIYIGTFVLLLVPAFFIVKVNKYEKMKWTALMLIIAISFVIPAVNLFWHAEDIPNWFPFRYSFLLSFVLLNMSLYGYEKWQTVKYKTFMIIFLLNMAILSIASFAKLAKFNLTENILFIFLFSILLFIKKYGKFRLELFIFVLFASAELLFNTSVILGNVYSEVGSTNWADYTVYKNYTDAVKQINQLDPAPYYRINTDLNKTDNDSLTIGYSSFSHSSSMLSNDLKTSLGAIGFNSRSVGYSDKGSMLLTDAIFGLKYFVSSRELVNPDFAQIAKVDNLWIYKNKTFLPIGYPVPMDIKGLNPSSFQSPFENQNKLFQTIFQTKSILYKQETPETVEFDNASVSKVGDKIQYTRLIKGSPIRIKYYFKVQSAANLYALFHLDNTKPAIPERETLTVYINNKKINNYFPSQFKGVIDMGTFRNEEAVMELDFYQKKVAFTSAATFTSTDAAKFQKDAASIDKNAFQLTQLTGNTLKAKVTVKEDNKLLFLSIPWDDGWRVTMNGTEVKPIKVLGAFMAIPLNQGTYNLQMTFIPKGFLAGCVISLISLFIFVVTVFRKNLQRSKKGTLHDVQPDHSFLM